MKNYKKIKSEKGITLIALIITIIILLILAMVSLKIITDSDIINHVEDAVEKYDEAQNNEMQKLQAAIEKFNEITNKKVSYVIGQPLGNVKLNKTPTKYNGNISGMEFEYLDSYKEYGDDPNEQYKTLTIQVIPIKDTYVIAVYELYDGSGDKYELDAYYYIFEPLEGWGDKAGWYKGTSRKSSMDSLDKLNIHPATDSELEYVFEGYTFTGQYNKDYIDEKGENTFKVVGNILVRAN